jgi:hypothetical protein
LFFKLYLDHTNEDARSSKIGVSLHPFHSFVPISYGPLSLSSASLIRHSSCFSNTNTEDQAISTKIRIRFQKDLKRRNKEEHVFRVSSTAVYKHHYQVHIRRTPPSMPHPSTPDAVRGRLQARSGGGMNGSGHGGPGSGRGGPGSSPAKIDTLAQHPQLEQRERRTELGEAGAPALHWRPPLECTRTGAPRLDLHQESYLIV